MKSSLESAALFLCIPHLYRSNLCVRVCVCACAHACLHMWVYQLGEKRRRCFYNPFISLSWVIVVENCNKNFTKQIESCNSLSRLLRIMVLFRGLFWWEVFIIQWQNCRNFRHTCESHHGHRSWEKHFKIVFQIYLIFHHIVEKL